MKLSGGSVDERLEGQFKDITRTILENQNEALGNLTSKVSNLSSSSDLPIKQVYRITCCIDTQIE